MATKKSAKKTSAATAPRTAVKKTAKKAAPAAKKAAPDKAVKRPAPAASKPSRPAAPAPRKGATRSAASPSVRPSLSATSKKGGAAVKAPQLPAGEIDLSQPLLRALARPASSAAVERAASVFQAAREFLPLSLILLLTESKAGRHVVAAVDATGARPFPYRADSAISEKQNPSLFESLTLPDRPEALKEIPYPGEEPTFRRGLSVPFDLDDMPGTRCFSVWLFDEGAPVPSRKQADIAALFLGGFLPYVSSLLARQTTEAALHALTEQHSRDLLAATQAAEARSKRLEGELQKLNEQREGERAKYAQQLDGLKKSKEAGEADNADLKERLARAEAIAATLQKTSDEQLAAFEQSCAREIQTLQIDIENKQRQIDEIQERLEASSTENARQVALITSEREAEIHRLRAEAERQLAELKNKSDQALLDLQASHARALSELKALQEKEKETLLTAHGQELQRLISDHEQIIKQLSTDHAAEMERLAASHARESEASMGKLEEELQLEIQLRDEELEKARSAAEDAKRSASESISEMEKAHTRAMEQQHRELTTASEQAVAALKESQERALLKASQAFESEKKTLTDRIATLEQGHGAALKKVRDEAESRITRLEEQRKQEQADSEAQKKRLEENHRSLVEGLQAELKGRDEQLREQKERIFNVQQTLDETRTRLEQEKEAHRHTKDQSNERIARIEEEGVLVVEELNGTIKEREGTIATLQQSLMAIQLREKEMQQEFSQASQAITTLKKERTDLEGRVRELEHTVSTERDTHAKTQARLQSELEAGLAEAARKVEEARSALAAREQELKSRSETLQKTEQALSQANARIQGLSGDLEEARNREQELLERIDEIERSAARTHQENRELHDLMREKNDEIRSYHMEEQRLKRSAQDEAIRATELERMIEEEKEALRLKDETLHRRSDEITALNARIEALGKDVENYLAVLQQRKETIDGLSDELEAARQQVKNSREEGHLLVEASRALSQIDTFAAKIAYLKDRVLRDIPLSRVVFYSMADDSTVVPVFSEPPLDLGLTNIPLSQTFFGQALASQKPALIKRKAGDEPADLPNPDLMHFVEEDRTSWESYRSAYERVRTEAGSSLIVPLVLGTKTEGVLVLGSDRVLDEKRTDMNMLEHLAPFVATAFREEKDRAKVEELSHTTQHQECLRRFIEKRSEQMIARVEASTAADPRLIQKTRFVAPFLSEDREAPGTGDVTALLDRIAESLKNSPIFTEFNVERAHLEHLIAGRDASLLLWLIGEAVTNVVEHSDARRLLIESSESHGIAGLKIEDDGEGLVRKTGSMSPETGRGFAAIKAMAALLHLELRITRGEGGLGTSLRLFKK